MQSTPDWSKVRAEFPALADWTYLDTASFGQISRRSSEAILGHLQHRDATASSQYISWFDDMDRIRESCARLIHCGADDIAFVPNASAGLSYLMQGFDWQAGDEILTLAGEFPNQLYQAAPASRMGLGFKAVAWPEFYNAVNSKTRAVLLSTVNYATGFRPPLEDISGFLREREILLYVDGTQSIGALQFNVAEIQPAMLCVNAYKWLCSPNGAGFIYVAPALREKLRPTIVGWRSNSGWREVANLNHGMPVFNEAAEKFEGGMLVFPSLYAFGAAVDLVLELGAEVVEQRVLQLANYLRSNLRRMGAEVSADESQIVTACFPDCDAVALASTLREDRILISARHGRLRISPHFYNDEADVEICCTALQRKLGQGTARAMGHCLP